MNLSSPLASSKYESLTLLWNSIPLASNLLVSLSLDEILSSPTSAGTSNINVIPGTHSPTVSKLSSSTLSFPSPITIPW